MKWKEWQDSYLFPLWGLDDFIWIWILMTGLCIVVSVVVFTCAACGEVTGVDQDQQV